MNIQQAKKEIIRTYRAYTRRRADGSHCIPPDKQRPMLLIGPPGIGKTAIMAQIASETGAGLVAYAMTHHTRQSAIGLPFISQREFGGREYSVTEYTMSEIVAAIYDYMAATGKRSGILFLDEINCVSETLAPVILQLLQNKSFGNHPLPEDWVIVAAGNPPEYNKSVRELDMATLDRVKHMEISADLPVWLEYARRQGIHPAIRSYLTVYPSHFYNITNADRGQLFVTARGWEDLSCILLSYEETDESVEPEFFLQYLQHDEIARSFAMYYSLFRRFSGAQGSGEARDGASFAARLTAEPERLRQCTAAECLAVASLFFESIRVKSAARYAALAQLKRLDELTALVPAAQDFSLEETRTAFFAKRRESVDILVSLGQMKPEAEFAEKAALDALEQDAAAWMAEGCPASFPETERTTLRNRRAAAEEAALPILSEIEEAYKILSLCPQGRGAELYFTGDLAGDPATEDFLNVHPSPVWLEHCRELLSHGS